MGRDACPWWRKDRRCYYVYFEGRQVRLDPDKKRAFHLWHELSLEPQTQEPVRTVGCAVDEYLANIDRTQKPSSQFCKRNTLLPYKADRGDFVVSQETPAAVVEWVCSHPTWGRSRRWLAGTIIKAMLRWAKVPIGSLGLPGPLSRGKDAVISDKVHTKLMEAAPPAYRDALSFLYATGCRPGEMVALEAAHICGNTAVLDEHKTDGSGKPRLIILPPAALALVARLIVERPTGKLFRNCAGRPIIPERLRCWFSETRKRLELGKVMLYGYRHKFATDALVKGIPDAMVAELLGHKGTQMLHRHYSHLAGRVAVLAEQAGKVRPGPPAPAPSRPSETQSANERVSFLVARLIAQERARIEARSR